MNCASDEMSDSHALETHLNLSRDLAGTRGRINWKMSSSGRVAIDDDQGYVNVI
ncbi:hypothetical protein Sjap_021520 [Stephania japonica]|uniref:Uncharacterized protein n=1 Tax=Stephania japonica TaxID=461633 RepID=A0AAP0EUB4_9MAGN